MNGYIPELAIATGLFEVAAAWFAFHGPGRREFLRPIGVLLLLLAGYQFLEVAACGQPNNTNWARLAFVDIVWLPAVGVSLIVLLSQSKAQWPGWVVRGMFTIATVLTGWIAFDPTFVSRTVCSVVVARYVNPNPLYLLYGMYYQLGLVGMIVGAAVAMPVVEDQVRRQHLSDVQVGTLGFLLPAVATALLTNGLDGSLPSVMCHYALALALFLARIVARERALAEEHQTSDRPLAA
jgi:hypothetical protein